MSLYHATLAALVDALLPEGQALPGGSQTGAAVRAAEMLARLPGLSRLGMKSLLRLVEYGSLLHGGRFSRLSRERRRELVSSWDCDGVWRARALLPLKLLSIFCYLEEPAVTRALHLDEDNCPPDNKGAGFPMEFMAPGQGVFDASYDVVIVGSGAGGAPAALEFARSGWSVAVIEEGEPVTPEAVRGRPLDRIDRFYRDGGTTFVLGNPPVMLPIGKAVGGTTVINSGTCFRTPDAILDSWKANYGIGMSAAEWGPYFEEVESVLDAQYPADDILGGNAAVLLRGAKKLGLHADKLFRNVSSCRGCGQCALVCPSGAKNSMDRNYLPQAVAAGAVVFPRCRVTRVLRDGTRATGVQGVARVGEEGQTRPFKIHAKRLVVIAAGTAFTPGLLRQSGFARKGVGGNLRLHPCASITGVFPDPVHGWKGVMQSTFVDSLADQGIMLEATFPPPSLAYSEASLSLSGEERMKVLSRFGHLATIGLLVSDTSSGRVHRAVGGRSPVMTYWLNKYDQQRLLKGLTLAARLFFAAGAEEVHPMIEGMGRIRSPEHAEKQFAQPWPLSALRLTAYHPMGTVRLGNDAGGLLDDAGRVHGATNLAVIDASVFPTSLAVNPQVTIMAFATRAARKIREAGR